MARDRDDYNRLLTELDADIESLRLVSETNRHAVERIAGGGVDELDYAALAYTIHNIYGVIEGYCLRVAKFYENGLEGESWHADLLRRMTLSIPELRPALLDRELSYVLDDLRAFRHKFRHLYARPIDPKRVTAVQEQVGSAVSSFQIAHARFRAALEEIRERLSDETSADSGA